MVTPPSGFTTLSTTYRGVEIWYNPSTKGYWCQPSAGYMSFDDTLAASKAYVDLILGPALPVLAFVCPTCGAKFATEAALEAHIASAHPVAPPPTTKDYLAETYRGVEVWWIDAIKMYRATVAAGYTAVGLTLPEVRTGIDGILAFLNPPPSGGDSLLGQIVDTIKAWLAPIFTPLQNAWSDFWTYTWPSWTSSFSSLKASWDYFNSYTVPSMMDNLRNLGARWDTFWTKDYPDMLAKSKAKEDELAARIETNKTALEAGTIEGDTATRSWMSTGFLGLLMDRLGSVPPAMFSGIFGTLSSSWAQGAAESFLRGLNEGLEE